ncbi:MAG: hypothetical protein JXR48_00520 [Candidatus Delongbacteria bacterium]|nr:hypothetical protein [Candidatus Delongbacteria bacterium]MBN2833425.1 hypothetical protein [Candidatus Delongbacteria bacterium]
MKIVIVLFLSYFILNAGVNHHVLIGGRAGYQLQFYNSDVLGDFIDNFNNQINRKIHSKNDGEELEKPDLFNGFFLEYSIYKYLDKSSDYMKMYDISCQFDFQSREDIWSFNYENVLGQSLERYYDYTYWSFSGDFSYGISPIKNIILSVGGGIGFERFDIKTGLNIKHLPDNVSKKDAYDFENNYFSIDNPNSQEPEWTTHTDSTSIQNGTFEGMGVSLKSYVKGEYFFTNNIAAEMVLGYKFSYIGRLEDSSGEKLRKNQDSQSLMDLSSNVYFLRFGLNYYFLME